MNDLLKYLIENRVKKANSRTINKFKVYLEGCTKNGVSIDQIKEEFNDGLTVEVFEAQVNDWFILKHETGMFIDDDEWEKEMGR